MLYERLHIERSWGELADDLDDDGRQGIYDLKDGTAIAENYLRGDRACHLHFVVARYGGDFRPEEFCAEFHPAGFETRSSKLAPRILRMLMDDRHDECVVHDDRGRWDQRWRNYPVLVHVGEIAQYEQTPDPERLIRVPSWVRLIPIDDCLVVRAKFGDRRTARLGTIASSSEDSWIGFDRELESLFIRNLPAGSLPSELIDKVIERGAEIMDDISDPQAAIDQQIAIVRHLADVDDVLLSIRLELYTNAWAVRFISERFPDALVQSVAMYASPLYLCPTAIEGHMAC